MICSFVLTSFHLLLLLPYVTSFPVKSLSLSKGVFECKNQEKIPRGWQCDGETDCQDGSDEMDCSFIKRPCNDALGKGRVSLQICMLFMRKFHPILLLVLHAFLFWYFYRLHCLSIPTYSCFYQVFQMHRSSLTAISTPVRLVNP